MAKYRIEIGKTATKQLKKINIKDRTRLTKKILSLADNPHPHGSIKMKGDSSAYRVRVGNYRIIYDVIEREIVILVLKIGHRKEVYR